MIVLVAGLRSWLPAPALQKESGGINHYAKLVTRNLYLEPMHENRKSTQCEVPRWHREIEKEEMIELS